MSAGTKTSLHQTFPGLCQTDPHSGGNLECSLKDTEMTWLLLTCCLGFFATVLLLLERHLKFTCPTEVHILVQAGVSDQSNSVSKWFLHPDSSIENIAKCCNFVIQLIKKKKKSSCTSTERFYPQLKYKGTYQISEV